MHHLFQRYPAMKRFFHRVIPALLALQLLPMIGSVTLPTASAVPVDPRISLKFTPPDTPTQPANVTSIYGIRCTTESTDTRSVITEDISYACDEKTGNTSGTKYTSYDTTSKLRIRLDKPSRVTGLSFVGANDDSTYKSRKIASANIYGCATNSTLVGSCTLVSTVNWTQSELDGFADWTEYTPKEFANTTSYQYYYITTTSYGEAYTAGPNTTGYKSGCPYNVNTSFCIQYGEIYLYGTQDAATDTTKPVSSVSYTPTMANSADNTSGITVNYSATDEVELLSIQVYASASPSLTSPTICGYATIAGGTSASGTVNCKISSFSDGNVYLYTRTTDAAGNIEDKPLSADDSFIRDTTAPSSNITGGGATSRNNVTSNLYYTATDGRTGIGSVTFYYSDTATLANAVTCFTLTFASPDTGTKTNISAYQGCTLPNVDGRYYLFSRATDVAGNVEAAPASYDQSYTVDNVAPVLGTISTNQALNVKIESTTAVTLRENATYGAMNIIPTISDSSTTTLTLSGPDASAFYVSGKTITISETEASKLDFENPNDADHNGVYQITLVATDQAGNVTTRDLAITLGNAAEILDITSTTTDGTYGIATSIPIQVKFDLPVTASSTANLRLVITNKTGTWTNAWYVSGNGTDTLVFKYTPVLGDTTTDLSYETTTSLSFTVGGPTLTANGFVASTTLPTPGTAKSLSGNKNIVIDALPTALTALSASSITGTSATINFTASETGTYYLLVLASGASTPSVSTVRAQGTAVAKSTSSMLASANSVSISGLTGATSYAAYLVGVDPLGNDTATAYRIPFTTLAADTTKPLSSGSIVATITNGDSATVAYTATDAGGLASIRVYYSTSALLTSPASCGTATISGTSASGSITCTLQSSDGTFYIFTRATDAAGNIEDVPGSADDSIIRDATAPLITGPSGSAGASTSSKNVAENSTVVATLTTNETATWTISGTDVSFFSIDSSTGVLTITARDFEAPADSGANNGYDVTVTATDIAGNTSSQTITVNITDIDEIAPLLSSNAASSITAGGVNLNFTTNETGTAYYLVYLATDSVPSAASVVAQGTAVAKGSASVSPGANSFTASGLASLTNYKGYVVVRDAAGNTSLVSTITFTTDTDAPSITSFSSNRTGTTSVAYGDTVTVIGTKFTGATAVQVGGVSVDTFTVVDSATITFVSNKACCTLAKVEVINPYGTGTSASDLIPLPQFPVITSQPASISKNVGDVATFSVTVSAPQDGGTLSYQWRKGTTNLIGETGTSYSVTTSSIYYAGTYSVIVTNTVGSTTSSVTSSGAVLTMSKGSQSPLTITSTAGVYLTPLNLTTSGGSTGGTVTYSTSTTGCTIAFTTRYVLTTDGGKTCVVNATMAGDTNYNPVSSGATNIVIASAPHPTLIVTTTEGTYGTVIPLSYTGSIGNGQVAFETNSPNCLINGGALETDRATTCSVRVVQVASSDYEAATSAWQNIVVHPKQFTISVGNNGASYTGSPVILGTATTYSVPPQSLIGNDAITGVTYSYEGTNGTVYQRSTTLPTNAGTYAIIAETITMTSDDLLNYTITKVNGLLTISGRTLAQPNAPNLSATTGILKSLSASWAAVTNAAGYKIHIYENDGTTLLETITGLSGTTKVITATDFPAIADNHTYKIKITATGDSNNSDSIASALSSAATTNKSYIITYDSNTATSGSVPAAGGWITGDSATVIAMNSGTLARTGYTFVGWNTAANGTGTNYAADGSATYSTTADLRLYAKWSANTLTITYKSDFSGGGSDITETRTAGSAFNLRSNTFTRTGYSFAGWALTSGGSVTNADSGSVTILVDTAYFAQWNAVNYSITYYGNNNSGGAVPVDSSNYNIGSTLTIKGNDGALTRTGYSFIGWTLGQADTGTVYLPSTANETLTVGSASISAYAKWSKDTYYVTYDSRQGSSVLNSPYQIGDTVTLASDPTRSGYTFAGWSTTVNGSSVGSTYAPPGIGTVTLYAKWSAINYQITYDSNTATSGTAPTDGNNYNIGGSVTVLGNTSNLVRSGYSFAGWNTAANGLGNTYQSGATFVMDAADVTLYAKWTAIDYSITYDSNTATSGSVPVDTNFYHIGEVVSIASSNGITRTGYTFAGWTVASNNTGTVMNSGYGLTFGAGNITVYAKWTANTYTVTFSANGASGTPSATSASYTTGGSAISLPTIGTMAKAGYSFDGWSTTSIGTPLTGTYTTSSDVALVAVWTAINYTVTYVSNGGSSTPTQTSLQIGQSFTLASGITKPNGSQGEVYAFVGWNDGSSTYQPGYTYRIGTANVTLTAVWVQVFEVSYAFNGSTDTPPSNQLKFDGATITLASAPSYPGYEFAGWTDQSNQMFNAGATYTVGSQHYLIRAVWNAINYTVTYQAAGGSTTPISGSYTIGQTFTLANAITRTGYTFTGWDNGSQKLAPGTSVVVGTSNMTFTAQWTANIYTVTYDLNGGTGSAISNDSYTYGTTALTLPLVGDRVRANHTFGGWSTVKGGSTLGLTYTPASTMTLFAIWNLNQYAITFNGNAVNVSNSTETYTAGSSALVLPTISRTGFVFKGWYSASTNGTLIGLSGASYTPTSTGSIYARWVQLSLSGVNESDLQSLGVITTQNGVGSVNTFTTADSTVSVTIPAGALPASTVVKFNLLDPAAIRTSMIPVENSHILSLVISWEAQDGTVPRTAVGKPIVMTVTTATIKKGATVYAIAGSSVQLLGTATQNGSVTVEITEDPEVAIVKTKPGAPRNVSATNGVDAASILTWEAPTSDGGDPIANYTVTSSRGEVCVTSTLSCAFNNLTNGLSYTFTVKAANTVGFSDPSAASAAITPGSPAPPSNGGSAGPGSSIVPALQIVLQEITNIQSTSVQASVLIAWPGKSFSVELCATLPTSAICDQGKKIEISSVEQLQLLPTGGYLISTEISNLKPSSQYTITAAIVTVDQRANSEPRLVKTTSGITLIAPASINVVINTVVRINAIATNVSGEVTKWSTNGLPLGLTITKGVTTLEITGLVKKIGTYFIDLTATDSDNGSAQARVVVTVSAIAPRVIIKSATMQPVAVAKSSISWSATSPGTFEVIYGDKSLCKSTKTSCVVPELLGPLSKVQVVIRNSAGGIGSSKAATYLSPKKPIEVGSSHFGLNSATLSPVEKKLVEKLTAILQAKGFSQLVVSGYTDSTGSKALNAKLSTARAKNTFNHLKKYLLLRPLTVTLSGKASTNPIASNATFAGRAANRRAVISIH